ncbi:MAG TPA: ATP12 family protein [Stellaceae bacterium]|jgi:chaperone required for assembly of F1-ATPase|nr:ATP12 family protein [Stellaceae bacterium]
MKRFYKEAKIVAADGEFAIELDGKPLRTPEKRALLVPTKQLAEAIASEWQGQGVTVKPLNLPLTRLVSTAIDRVTPRRTAVIGEIAKYATTDLLCYRADEPHELVERQEKIWQPLLDWAEARLDASFAVTQGVTPVAQTPATLTGIERAIAAHDAMRLVALHLATTACGSVVLGLALLAERISAEEAFAAAQLDETFQIERWGEDAEQTKTRAALKEDIALAARFAALLRAD